MSTVLSGMFTVRFHEEPHLGQKIPEMLYGKSKLERKSKEKLLWGVSLREPCPCVALFPLRVHRHWSGGHQRLISMGSRRQHSLPPRFTGSAVGVRGSVLTVDLEKNGFPITFWVDHS